MEYSGSAMEGYRSLADLHKALAHPIRLRILDILARNEACVCHLTAVLGMRQPYVSQQLGALRDAGLVVARRDGTLIYYRLRDARLAALLSLGRSVVESAVAGAASLPPVPEAPVADCQCPTCQSASTVADSRDRVGAVAPATA
jgi:ArsR family transcriptional regulator